ncbi:unnamed protein product [Pleuronectes platessa]|uniref:Uncharacterized protein n=1 Tax=Pleuronectes platessa TaxID=8262 RepID=A0A9N7Z4K3_PLEPL|nr:unnamed protein product [Pleuronectes platessa]
MVISSLVRSKAPVRLLARAVSSGKVFIRLRRPSSDNSKQLYGEKGHRRSSAHDAQPENRRTGAAHFIRGCVYLHNAHLCTEHRTGPCPLPKNLVTAFCKTKSCLGEKAQSSRQRESGREGLDAERGGGGGGGGEEEEEEGPVATKVNIS